jgi:RimJ/RimL family protein N-acetyltransferase
VPIKLINNNQVSINSLSEEGKKQIEKWDEDSDVSKYREPYNPAAPKLESINFGIYIGENKSQLIGSIDISSIDLKNNHAEIGMAIGDKNYWGKGIGTESVKLILNYCFVTLNLNKVYLDVWEDNIRAIKCYQKCGFKTDGLLRQHVFKDNKYYSKIIMSILKSEWSKL